jgi:hypothetical protein
MTGRRADAVEERLAALARLRLDPDATVVAEGVRMALRDPSAQVIARAARLAVELARADLAPELTAAFLRLLGESKAKDPGCAAKTALAAALVDLELPEVEAMRRGIRVQQWEPVYGGRIDVAAELRAHCALGLAGTAVPGLMHNLADLLADPEAVARSGAIRALAACSRIEAPPLLRFKARLGDDDPEVLGQCYAALLAVDPEGSLEVVADALNHDDDIIVEAAALALGGSRSKEAFAVLCEAVEGLVHGERRRVLLTAIALLRLDPAVDYLIELVREGPLGTSLAAVEALAAFRHDGDLRRRTESAVRERGDARLEEVFSNTFIA